MDTVLHHVEGPAADDIEIVDLPNVHPHATDGLHARHAHTQAAISLNVMNDRVGGLGIDRKDPGPKHAGNHEIPVASPAC